MSDLPRKEKTLPIMVRPATQGDVNFILNSWIKSAYSNLPKAYEMPNFMFCTEHHKLIEAVLKRSTVIVACDRKDPSIIYGYLVAEYLQNHPTIHYIYVKQTFRRLGLASYLINCLDINQESIIFISHTTLKFKNFFGTKRHFIFNPYLFHQYGDHSETIGLLENNSPIKAPSLENGNETKN